MQVGDILRAEIWHHFKKLILVYVIGLPVFIVFALLFVISAVVLDPWRLKVNYVKMRVIL